MARRMQFESWHRRGSKSSVRATDRLRGLGRLLDSYAVLKPLEGKTGHSAPAKAELRMCRTFVAASPLVE